MCSVRQFDDGHFGAIAETRVDADRPGPTPTGRRPAMFESVVERLLDRIHRFTLVHDQALSKRTEIVAQVDARYSNGVAVRWRPVGALAMLDQRPE